MKLNRIKIVSSLMWVLILFSILQLISGASFFSSLSDSKNNIKQLQNIRNEQYVLNETFVALIQARLDINHAVVLYLRQNREKSYDEDIESLVDHAQKAIQESDTQWKTYEQLTQEGSRNISELETYRASYRNALAELVQFIKTGDMEAAIEQPTQGYQERFESEYVRFDTLVNQMYQEEIHHTETSRDKALIITLLITLVWIIMLLIIWLGIRAIIVQPLAKIISAIRFIADGKLAVSIDVLGHNEMGKLADALREMQEKLSLTVANVRNSADIIFTSADEITHGNNELSSRTEQQAASLEQTAASMEQLTTSVKQNAESAAHANRFSLSTIEVTGRGQQAVNDVQATMDDITESSRKISDMTRLIDDIAFQTNILALNAAVEAARAGEQGRGFAVVAREVRQLAHNSARAAREIEQLVSESVGKVGMGSAKAELAGETMMEIHNAVVHVSSLMNEIAQMSEEQSRGITQINQAVEEMNTMTQMNAVLVEESSGAAERLEQQAHTLMASVALFHSLRCDVKGTVPDVV